MKTYLFSKDKQTTNNCRADQKIYTQKIQLQQIIDYEMYFEKIQAINLWIIKENMQSNIILKEICKILFKKSINNITYSNIGNNEIMTISTHSFHNFEFDQTAITSYINFDNDKIVEQHRIQQNNFSVYLTVFADKSKKQIENEIKLHQNSQCHNYLLLFVFTDKDQDLLDDFLNPDIVAKESAKLSQEYLYIKQQIQQVKAQFKNKLKGLEIIIGQSIQVEKLLTDIKEENTEFKRLKEVFQTIRNIDAILEEQQRKLAQATKKVKDRQVFKYTLQHQHAKSYNKKKQEIIQKKKQIAQIQDNIAFLGKSEKIPALTSQHNISDDAQKVIQQQINLYKRTINKDFIIREKPSSIKITKNRCTVSAISEKQQKRKQFLYEKCAKKHSKNVEKQNQLQSLQQLGLTLYKIFTKNNKLIEEVESVRNKNKPHRLNNSQLEISEQQFPLINKLLQSHHFFVTNTF